MFGTDSNVLENEYFFPNDANEALKAIDEDPWLVIVPLYGRNPTNAMSHKVPIIPNRR